MAADPALVELASSLGIRLDGPTRYTLADTGPRVFAGNGRPSCPMACEGTHGEPGNSCPFRWVPIDVALPDPYLRRLKTGGAL